MDKTTVRRILALALTLSAAVASGRVGAQTPTAPRPVQAQGWQPHAVVGSNLSLGSSTNAIGQADGDSQTFGLSFKGDLNDLADRSEWRNSLSYLGATSKTPNLPQYVKSSDELRFETAYLYSLTTAPAFGPYANASAQTAVFAGQDARPTPTTYNVLRANGAAPQTVVGSTLKLTDGFRPLTTKESTGGFWKAVQGSDLNVEARLGFGAQQIAAAGQLAVTGSNPDGSVSVKELSDVQQGGAETSVAAKGRLNEQSSYEASADVLVPFIANKSAGDDRDALRLTNFEGRLKLSSKITSWASLTYDYKLILQPQLLDRAQQTYMLVLNLNYNLL